MGNSKAVTDPRQLNFEIRLEQEIADEHADEIRAETSPRLVVDFIKKLKLIADIGRVVDVS
jgi:hypothetical protein